jgi:preprotein translocase subunit SecY
MAFEDSYIGFLKRLPSVVSPIKRLTFRDKLKWTGIILLIYLVMTQIPVFGVSKTSFEQFRLFEILLGSTFGSLMTLGIGPIVTASIVLQLLAGSKILPWDLTTESGKVMFQGTQKLLAVLFCIIEAGIFVSFGTIPPSSPEFTNLVILQLAIGGILVLFMDEIVSKWGFGSGISLFIVAGVSKTMVVRMFNPLTRAGTFPTPTDPPSGIIPFAITAIGTGEVVSALISLLPVIATALVFLLVVYINAVKVEVPIAFGSVRGFGRRWPLKFLYTSNIPVILTGALLANFQLVARSMSGKGMSWLGTFNQNGAITGGLIYFLSTPGSNTSPGLPGLIISIGAFALIGTALAYFLKMKAWKTSLSFALLGGVFWFFLIPGLGIPAMALIEPFDVVRIFTYSAFMIGGAVLFSYFWVITAGMDPKSVASQIHRTGMQIPGFRRDVRIIERVLNRYIPGLAIMGGAAVGFLASFADLTNALGTGTGILLSTMIVYQLYEEIATQHLEDMHPAMRRFISRT